MFYNHGFQQQKNKHTVTSAPFTGDGIATYKPVEDVKIIEADVTDGIITELTEQSPIFTYGLSIEWHDNVFPRTRREE